MIAAKLATRTREETLIPGRQKSFDTHIPTSMTIREAAELLNVSRAYVISKNLHRRHLNESQRAMIAARLANIGIGEAGGGHEKTDSQITLAASAELLNVSRASFVPAV